MAGELSSVPGPNTPEEDFRRLEDELGRLARELTEDDVHLEAPPLDLWSLIEAEAEADVSSVSGAAADEQAESRTPREIGGARLRTSRIGTPRGLGASHRTPTPAQVSELRSRSGFYSIPAALAVAAALAVVLATGAALIVRTSNAD
ncbi:MAG: hypothetical protein OEW83_16485, partial [Acidimicrobiia bacterium]|nr:hypothetical protein [Acidimicrobiia bacterium]